MRCLLCGQTMKAVLTFSSLLLLRNDVSCLCLDCDSTFEKIGEERASSSKNRSERLGTELPFFIKRGVTIPKKILLIDDIYTTGTTINRVKKLLEEAGAEDVKTFSLVR